MIRGLVGRIVAVGVALLIVFMMLITTIAPGGFGTNDAAGNQVPTTDSSNDAEPPTVEFPAPDTTVNASSLYVHPSGVFVVAQPDGFDSTVDVQETIVSVSMVNMDRYSVVHAYIEQANEPQSLSTLEALYTPEKLASSWSQYDNWVETDREITENYVTIDFELSFMGSNYLARHITWPSEEDSALTYVVRFVVPDNNPGLLDTLEASIIPSFAVLPESLSVPMPWAGYVDAVGGFVMRYPEAVTLRSGSPGSLAMFAYGDDTLSLSSEAGQVQDEAAVEAWLAAEFSDTSIVSIEPIERTTGEGFAVSFAYADADGAPQSALAMLINGAGDQFVTAILHQAEEGIDVLAPEIVDANPELWTMLDTFAPLPVEAILRTVE